MVIVREGGTGRIWFLGIALPCGDLQFTEQLVARRALLKISNNRVATLVFMENLKNQKKKKKDLEKY